jgi:hypothetical protein
MGIEISLECPAVPETIARVDAIYARFGCEPDTGGMVVPDTDTTEAVTDLLGGKLYRHVHEIDYDGYVDLDKAIACLQAFKAADIDAYISYPAFGDAFEEYGMDNPILNGIWDYIGPHEVTKESCLPEPEPC